LKKPYKP